jgi:hypothetical protein
VILDPKVGAIGQLYTSEQQEIIRQILKGILTEDGHERIQKQMKDDSGGFENYTCAVFGDPSAGKFEWVITGRHLTLRADGNSVQNAALGGPIFYAHAVEGAEKPDHPGNVWWHQALLANKVYESLDGKQRELALLPDSPSDDSFTVFFEGIDVPLPGIQGHELSGDQKEHLEGALKGLLAMFRQSDVDEVMECLRKNGGIDTCLNCGACPTPLSKPLHFTISRPRCLKRIIRPAFVQTASLHWSPCMLQIISVPMNENRHMDAWKAISILPS